MGGAIKEAAVICAEKLSLALCTCWNTRSLTGEVIESLESSCPYEYADGAKGIIPVGIFAIQNARQIEKEFKQEMGFTGELLCQELV